MVSTVFKLVDLCRLYSTRIEELGVLKTARVHSRIEYHFPNLRAYKEGRDILFCFFQEDIGQTLKSMWERLLWQSDASCYSSKYSAQRYARNAGYLQKIKGWEVSAADACGNDPRGCQHQSSVQWEWHDSSDTQHNTIITIEHLQSVTCWKHRMSPYQG